MKYMLLIYHNENAWNSISDDDRQRIYGQYGKLREELIGDGKWVSGSQLHDVSTASTIRVRDGKPMITDGPFAETHEQLGGYFLVEVKDLDEANAIAARIPSAVTGSIEVRPLVERAAPAAA